MASRLSTLSEDGGRAQTVQDFAIGASIFLLTVSFVFAFVPSIFAPFSADVSPGAAQQADRVAAKIIDQYSYENRSNWLREGDLQSDILSANQDTLRNKFGLPITAQINVTVVKANPESGNGAPATSLLPGGSGGGKTYNDRPAATVSRVVVVADLSSPGGPCDPRADTSDGSVCRLVVRIW